MDQADRAPLPPQGSSAGRHEPAGTRDGRARSKRAAPATHVGGLAARWQDRRQIGGVPFVVSTPRRAARDLAEAARESDRGEHVHLLNAYSIALADRQPDLAAEAFVGDGWNLPDGRPVSWVSRIRGDRPALRQIRGPQFMLDVCEQGVAVGVRHYLLGATPPVLEALRRSLEQRYPGIEIVGVDSPPFRTPSDAELAERDARIRASGADIVWVGLGTPKQDREVARLAASLPVTAVAVGAAFDYAAGTLKEAPAWMSKVGLEWAFRFAVEPRRLWRRYVFGNARFLRAAVQHWSAA